VILKNTKDSTLIYPEWTNIERTQTNGPLGEPVSMVKISKYIQIILKY
jgi:hypothetical protein